ncbi:hypothetical protein BD324DRAFT_628816 [Kockovaella imperatae]|uniref:Uncharacterized protein n=1 Tax=Kockovaella imperatae TaxID=4999 RepID=A0A1Y1UFZ5_9TREE|nr:hypothetical protein BD324DRAFT_628816 [Kockovaella imperatae]ORX36434.1 hypothetical protein BD324DRAFT_628816 [Kockovaella imperatae]
MKWLTSARRGALRHVMRSRRMRRPVSSVHLHSVTPLLELRDLLLSDFAGLEVWTERLEKGIQHLKQPGRRRLGIWGTQYSGRSEVVSALTQDVLEDNDKTIGSLLNRADHTKPSILLGCDSNDDVVLPSSWLRRLNLCVVEVTSENESTVLSELLQCDVVLIVLDPYTTLDGIPAALRPLLHSPSALVVINGKLPPSYTQTQLANQMRQRGLIGTSLSFIHAADALAAMRTFNGPNPSTYSLDRFQGQYLASGVGNLQRVIEEVPSGGALAARLMNMTLHAAGSTLESDTERNQHTQNLAMTLASEVQRAAKGSDEGVFRNVAQDGFTHIRKRLERNFQTQWSWFNLLSTVRIDDCGKEIEGTIRSGMHDTLQAQLAFALGKLEERQALLMSEADRALTMSSRVDCGPSALVQNELAILARGPKNSNNLRALISCPDQEVLDRLVPRLQRSADKASIAMLAMGSMGISVSWAATQLDILTGTTGAACSLLGILCGVRLGQHLWHRAQRLFWKDWDRITVLLSEECESQVSTLGKPLVTGRALAISQALSRVAQGRLQRLDVIKARIRALQQQVSQQ